VIRFEDVSKAYDGRPVLSHVTGEVPSGGVLWVQGPNGVGKSTLLKIVLGLVNPDSGVVDGLSGRRVSAVFQEDRLCPWLSAIGNIRLVVPSMGRVDAEAALDAMDLPREAMARPVRQLSGGQRRRVAIARALAAPADIVCLDEPFTGIDAASLPDVAARMAAGTQGKDVLLVTHDHASATPFSPSTLILTSH